MQKILSLLINLTITTLCYSAESESTPKKYELSICAIFKNEAPYLKEWIEFHKLQGVQHFFLYNNNSSDDYLNILSRYIETDQITLIDWPYFYKQAQTKREKNPWLAIQSNAYMDCIRCYGEETSWLAYIDLDEFLFCPDGTDLKRFLKNYRSYGGLCVNWLLFGTSFLEDIPPDSLLIESLIRCAPANTTRNRGMKSIVQPSYVTDCKNAHSFVYKQGYRAVTATGKKTVPTQEYSDEISHNFIRINHYWTRTESYFRNQKSASRRNRRAFDDETAVKTLALSYNDSSDDAILRFVPELKKRMSHED